MGQPLPYTSVSDFRWPALRDPTVQVQAFRHEKGQLVHRRPVLGILQPGRRLKQAPEQLDDHSAVVGLQQFAVGQGVLAAPAAKELPFLCEQVQAGLEALLGQAPGFGDQHHACLHGGFVPDLIRPAQGQGIDRLLGDLPKQFFRRGMGFDFFHQSVLLTDFGVGFRPQQYPFGRRKAITIRNEKADTNPAIPTIPGCLGGLLPEAVFPTSRCKNDRAANAALCLIRSY